MRVFQTRGCAARWAPLAFSLLAIVTAVGAPAPASASAGDDDVILTLTGSPTQELTLDWTGGLPDYEIHRALDPQAIASVTTLTGLTSGAQYVESSLRPSPGEVFYYAVTESELHAGVLPEMWINGENCGTEPAIQVQQYNDNTFILRESLCTNFEGPFMYLLFGEDTVLLEDTGAVSSLPLAATVYAIIDQWLFDNGRASIDLSVVHSHAHGDHVQCDFQFQGQPDTTVVGLGQVAVANFFGITNWPDEIVTYDLGGGRIVDILPIPGHQTAHIALYDRQNGWLLTGDTLYPGRLYVSDFPTYIVSIQRMVDFIVDKPVVAVLGTHIEMTTTPYVDFPFGSSVHIDEHELQLTRDHLQELLDGAIDMADDPKKEPHPDFIIFPL